MLMTFDHWLTRFFGASRRAGRPAPMAQRAAFGHDGMDLRQIDSFAFRSDLAPEWDDAPATAPYAPYVRKPRVLSPDSDRFALITVPAQPDPAEFFVPAFLPAPEQLRREAQATQRSKEFFRDLSPGQLPPRFSSDNVIAELENTPAPLFWRVDQPNVRFHPHAGILADPPQGGRGSPPPRRGGSPPAG